MLDNSEIEAILKELHKDEDVSLIECVERSSKIIGENWDSNLVILNIKAKIGAIEKVFHWLGKFPPENESSRRFNRLAHLEEKEIAFYSDFVPKLMEFKQGRISLNICPVYHSKYSENGDSFFIMENLKERGYVGSVNKIPGLDLEHCKRVVEELARFHAASHAYITSKTRTCEDDEMLKLIKRDFIFLEAEEGMKKSYDTFGHLDCVRQTLESIQEPDENWTDKFNELVAGRSIRELVLDTMTINPDGFNVQVHNDLWICNLLFNYDSVNRPKAVCFIDWAMTSWNNPALNLINFITTSANPDVLNNHFLELMEIYHSILMTTLEKLDVTNVDYSFEDLLHDYDRRVLWGSFTSLIWIPLNLGDKDDFSSVREDFGDQSQGENFGRYIRAMGKVILDKKGATHPYLRPRLRAIFKHVLQRTQSK